MNRFDKIAEELGWKRLYKNITVFMSKSKDKDGYLSINFPCGKHFDDFNFNDERINKTFVNNLISKISCNNKFEESDKSWVVPMMIADYFAHREDYNNELIWAKKAMKENKELKPKHFSFTIREQL